MNIGIVTTWFARGAAYVSKAYRETLVPDHDVYIYARAGELSGRGDPYWDEPYVTWGIQVPDTVITHIDWDDFSAWAVRHRLDVILFNEQMSWDVVVRARSLGIPIGAYVDYYTARTVPLFRLYDFVICNTRRHYSVFRDHPNALFIPWGTDCDVFRPRQRGGAHEEITFFHSAGMRGTNGRKGTDVLVAAFQNVTGPARLVIHSQLPAQEYPEWELIRADPRIEFVEETVGPPGLYHLGDVYAYPTKLEGIGLTIPEALACGLPVITTDAAPMNEFVLPGVTGSLVEVASVRRRSDSYYWPETVCSKASLTLALQSFIDRREQLPTMSRAARDYAVTHLDWRKNSAMLKNFMRTVERLHVEPATVNAAIGYERSHYPVTGARRVMRSITWRLGRARAWVAARARSEP